MAARGRPSKFTEALATRICERLAAGETLIAVCRDDGMPNEQTVRRWVMDDYHGFSRVYREARELGYARWADEIKAISDTPERGEIVTEKADGSTERKIADMIEHRKLQLHARQWLLARALPNIYGDRQHVEHSGEVSIAHILDTARERLKNARG